MDASRKEAMAYIDKYGSGPDFTSAEEILGSVLSDKSYDKTSIANAYKLMFTILNNVAICARSYLCDVTLLCSRFGETAGTFLQVYKKGFSPVPTLAIREFSSKCEAAK